MQTIALCLAALAVAATAHAKIVTEKVPYRDGDTRLEGLLIYDDAHNGKRPAVIVVHEWWGRNDFAQQRATQLAKLGYVAFALDMYGDGKVTESTEQAGTWARALYSDPAAWRARAKAGFDVVASHERVDRTRIAAIGYCFGGATVQQMALAGLPLRGVVSFHGSLVMPSTADAEQTRAGILILHGAADTLVPDEQLNRYIAAMRKTKLDWQLITYAAAKHSFTNPKADDVGIEGVGYNKKADERSWTHMRTFFAEIFEQRINVPASA